jgi:hypothetical protein
MLKKFTWIAAALLAMLAMAFFGCTDAGGLDDGSQPKPAVDLVIEGDDIVLEPCGNQWSQVEVDGNKVTFNNTTGNMGFYYQLPAAAADYGEVVFYFKVIKIVSGKAGFLVKNTDMSNFVGVANDQDPQYQLNDDDYHFTDGMEFTSRKKTGAFKNNRIAFFHQAYNPSTGNTGGTWSVEVTKIVFPGGGGPSVDLTPRYTGDPKKIIWDKKTVQRFDDVIVDQDPSFTASPNADESISATGVITMANTKGANVALYYKFPTSALEGTIDASFNGTAATDAKPVAVNIAEDYDEIEITFNTVYPETADAGKAFKVRIQQYNSTTDYGGSGWVNNFGTDGAGTGKTHSLQVWGARGTDGFTILFNNDGGAQVVDLKITKVTFKAAERNRVSFFIGNEPAKVYDVKTGNTIAQSSIPASVLTPTIAGWTFNNWCTDVDLNTAYTASTPITADIALFAKFTPVVAETPVILAPWTVTAAANATLFADIGSGSTVTVGGKSYWVMGKTGYDLSTSTITPTATVTAADITAIKAAGTVQTIAYTFTMPTGPDIPAAAAIRHFKTVTIAYEAILLANTDGTPDDDGPTSTATWDTTVFHSEDGTGTNYGYPWFNSTSWSGTINGTDTGISISKGGTPADTGAYLLRIISVTLSQ